MNLIDNTSPFNYTNYNFVTSNSIEITNEILYNAEKNINRVHIQLNLNNILTNIELAMKIELSIFEYALIYCHTKQFSEEFIKIIYIDKFNEIYDNLTNSHGIINNTLKNSLINNNINPSHIAFMSPSQLNYDNWIKLIKKKEIKNTIT